MIPFFSEGGLIGWHQLQDIKNTPFLCGFCSTNVSSVKGYKISHQGNGAQVGAVYICPNCRGAVFITPDGKQFPSAVFGNPVQHVPKALNDLYEEARRCTGQNCHTGAVLLCRKMLMNIAVEQSADPGLSFIEYVNFLAEKGYVPPNGKHWVDHIRKKGNEATHEITLMGETDAKELLIFTEMLLRFIYVFPKMIPDSPSAP